MLSAAPKCFLFWPEVDGQELRLTAAARAAAARAAVTEAAVTEEGPTVVGAKVTVRAVVVRAVVVWVAAREQLLAAEVPARVWWCGQL